MDVVPMTTRYHTTPASRPAATPDNTPRRSERGYGLVSDVAHERQL